MTAREWFHKAQEENFAIGAFNCDNLEIFKAICMGAKNKKSPVMIEFSKGEVGYFGLENIIDLTGNAREYFEVPILLNLDHAKTFEECQAAIDAEGGDVIFDDIHLDGSELEFDKNVEEAKKVVEAAHKKGILVEGEIDKFLGSSEVHEEEIDPKVIAQSYTDPGKAAEYVVKTGVDILATSFGNIHGVFPKQPDLDFELLSKIKSSVPNTFLSLHGGSGIPVEQVKRAIEVGKIVKVNVNTELRQTYRDALAEKMGESAQFKSYEMMEEVILAVAAVVEAKIDVFGSSDKI